MSLDVPNTAILPIFGTFRDFFDNSTLVRIVIGTALLGMVSGALGCFAFLRRQSLLGDGISHAALPGIAIAFLIVHDQPLWLILGAASAGILATWLMQIIVRYSSLGFDTALAIVSSVFFGTGMVLLSWIQGHVRGSSSSGLEKYLFGQAALMIEKDVQAIAITCTIIFLILFLFWKELKITIFDPEFAASCGYNVPLLEKLILALLVLAIVIGLESVGVVLMSAMVVAPAAAARQWTNRFGRMVFLAAFFGAVSATVGSLSSDYLATKRRSIPTGPMIVLVALSIVFCSSLCWRCIYQFKRTFLSDRSRKETGSILSQNTIGK